MTNLYSDGPSVQEILDRCREGTAWRGSLIARELENLIARIAELEAQIKAAQEQQPVAAQHRFRSPQKTRPNWSIWQPCAVANRPPREIDNQGYEVEYRNLYASPVPTPADEELRRDAERYRWLRDPCSGAERVIFYCRGDYGRGLMSSTMLDAAIDEAMEKEEGK